MMLEGDRRGFLNLLMAGLAAEVVEAQQPAGNAARPVLKQALPAPFTGMDANFTLLTVQPGPPVSRPHTHAGFVLGYVIEGDYLFAINNETPRVVHAGEIFYEPPGAVHTTSASANPDKMVKLLAIVIGPLDKAVENK